MLQLHDFDGGQVLAGLRLGAGLVARDQEQGGVHDGRPVQHGGHEDVVAGAVHEADVPDEPEAARACGAQAGEVVVFRGAARDVARRPGAFRVVALVDLSVRVTWKRSK